MCAHTCIEKTPKRHFVPPPVCTGSHIFMFFIKRVYVRPQEIEENQIDHFSKTKRPQILGALKSGFRIKKWSIRGVLHPPLCSPPPYVHITFYKLQTCAHKKLCTIMCTLFFHVYHFLIRTCVHNLCVHEKTFRAQKCAHRICTRAEIFSACTTFCFCATTVTLISRSQDSRKLNFVVSEN